MADEQIKVTTAVDNTGFSAGLEQMKEQSKEFGESLQEEMGGNLAKLSGAGVAVAAVFVAAFESVKEAIGEAIEKSVKFANASERFGVGTASLQEMSNAAEQHGATMDDVTSAYNKLEINSQKAIEGNKEMVDSFAALGVSVDDLKSKSLEDIMNQIADGTANAKDKGEAYTSVVGVLGKSAGNLFDTLQLGSAQIKAVGDASGVMSDITIRSLDGMEKSSKSLWGRFTAWSGEAFVSAWFGAQWLFIEFQSGIQEITQDVIAFGQLVADIFSHPLRGANFTEFTEKLRQAAEDATNSANERIQNLQPAQGEGDDPGLRAARAGEDSGAEKAEKAKEDAAKKTTDEIARINKEADEKERQAKYDALTLDQKIAEQKKLIYQKSTWFGSGNKLEEANARLAIAIASDTLEKLEKEKDAANKRELEKANKKEKDKAKAAVEIASKKISVEEEELRKLEALNKKESPASDELRKIGGGFAGVNYGANSKDTAMQNQVDLLKQQIDLQKQELTLLKAIANPDTTDDGSYTVSS